MFDTNRYDTTAVMTVSGLSCVLNLPRAREKRYDAAGNELDQSLPEYSPRAAFSVADYTVPEQWVKPGPDEASYFVPVAAGRGLWLDFNRCASDTHHVAVLVSVQGVNAITGQPTRGHGLEQYKHQCPIHGVTFGADRYCPSCGYKWPAQNYLATTGTPRGSFWLDGFRTEDGTTRQFVFTEEMARSVAAQLIGQDRVFAIAVRFYRSVSPKPVAPVYRGVTRGGGMKSFGVDSVLESTTRGASRSLEVGYGARIAQRVYPDHEHITFWRPQPDGTIYINYVDEETCQQLLNGRRNRQEGFLNGLQGAAPAASGGNRVF